MRWAVVVGLSVMLCACYTRDPFVTSPERAEKVGRWHIERQIDRVTSAPISSALAVGKASNGNLNYPTPVWIQLACFNRQPLVRFEFQFKIGTNRNTELGYRFDENPGHDSVASRILGKQTVLVIEEQAAVARFVEELATARVLYIHLRSLHAARTAVIFKLEGAPAAIKAAFATCPVVAGSGKDKT